MNKLNSLKQMVLQLAIATFFLPSAYAASNSEHSHAAAAHTKATELGTDAALDKDGKLWVVTKEVVNGDPYVVMQTSTDLGKTWSAAQRIQRIPEPVAARGEARPHIALGTKGEIYISYTKPVAPPHIGDIRLVRSLDGGKTFSEPVTVHANRDVITHSFESMLVDQSGKLYLVWIDGRDAVKAKTRNQRYAGSAVYYAVSEDRGATFKGDYKIADNSCECCRIGLALNNQGKPIAMWRHVFAPNVRDHAVAELASGGSNAQLTRVTFDDWRVDACPHHGPSLAFGPDGTRHQVWFSGKENQAGAFYANAERDGALTPPLRLGSDQASHPDIAVSGKQIAIAWKQFDGKSTSVMVKTSIDGGTAWSEKLVASTTASSDQPHLISNGAQIVAIWRTQDQGIVVIPLLTGK